MPDVESTRMIINMQSRCQIIVHRTVLEIKLAVAPYVAQDFVVSGRPVFPGHPVFHGHPVFSVCSELKQ